MSAARHQFKSRGPVDRFSEQVAFYGKLRGTEYNKAMPVPKTLVSDLRQLVKTWNAAAMDALMAFARGLAKAWKGIYKRWVDAAERVKASKLAPNEVYDDNAGFWIALRRLASQLGARDMIMTRGDVLVWAVKDTVREHGETLAKGAEAVAEHAEAVYEAGKSAANAVAGAAGAIPTIAKALAVAAVGLGVYAVARK